MNLPGQDGEVDVGKDDIARERFPKPSDFKQSSRGPAGGGLVGAVRHLSQRASSFHVSVGLCGSFAGIRRRLKVSPAASDPFGGVLGDARRTIGALQALARHVILRVTRYIISS